MRAAYLSILLLTAQAIAAAPVVDLRFKDVDLRTIFTIGARLAGRNILLGKEVKGQMSLDLRSVDAIEALKAVAAVNRWELIEKNGFLIVGDSTTIQFVRGSGDVQAVQLRHSDASELAERLNRLYKGKLDITADPRTNTLLITRTGK